MIFTVAPGMPQKISTVCLDLNTILLSNELHEELEAFKNPFDQSNIDGPTLSSEIKRILPGRSIKVQSYVYPWYKTWFNKSVVAHVKDSSSIYLTKYFLGVNDDVDYANTIGHETIHVIDNLSPYWFGHGDNNPSGDGLTAPHILGDICARLYKKRRDQRLILCAKDSNKAYEQFLVSIGATNFGQFKKLLTRGIYGETQESSLHIID